ncbi:MAG: hypothetical protein GY720_17800 [bacterium]|nr:hypothetical protein [bacterium]
MQNLRRTIRANSVFSEVSGGVLLLGAGLLDGVFGLDSWFLALLGASLVGYGALLWLRVRRDDVRPLAKLAAVLDVDWVIAAAVVLVAFPTAMTTTGRGGLFVVSLFVAGFAAEQIIALRRLRSADLDRGVLSVS